jgi:membrane protease YdiL (CAAX protease family)
MSIAAVLILVYVLLRVVGDPFFWQNISELFAYGFDLAFVLVTYGFFRKRITLLRKPGALDFLYGLLMMVAGGLVYKCAGMFSVPVPFDFSEHETIVLLLIVAPLLEEAIFRMALWEAFLSLTKNRTVTNAATTMLFAAGHFVAYWSVPEQFQIFVIYQTIYVLILGGVLGWRRASTNAVSSSVILHFGFNLGFLLGALL